MKDDRCGAMNPSFPFDAVRRRYAEVEEIRLSFLLRILCVSAGELRLRREEPLSSPGRVVVLRSLSAVTLFAVANTEILHLRFCREFLDQLSIGLWDSSLLVRFFPPAGQARTGGAIQGFSPDDESRGEFEALFSAIVEEYASAGSGYRQMIRAKILEILILLARLPPERRWCSAPRVRPPASAQRAGIEELKRVIRENYTEGFTLEGMARRCGLNSSYFSRLFRESAGVPPFEYLNRIRVQKACLLLKRTDMTILDIAMSVGYNNVSFFNRYFRKVMKMSPREYRAYVRR